MRMRNLGAAAIILALTAAPASAQQVIRPGAQISGELRSGDSTLESGEFVDSFVVDGRSGQRLVVRATSTAFDSYLLIRGPGGFQQDNDDEAKDNLNALLDVRLPADGRYTISVTSASRGETGRYALSLGGAESAPAVAAVQPGAIRVGETVRGTLAQGDETLGTGEFVDTWRLTARRGERFTLRLSSGAFDPYLLVRGPNNLQEENDDDPAARGSSASRLVITMPADGELGISVTSYKPGESGAYALAVEAGGDATPAPVAQAPVNARAIALNAPQNGTLASGDGQLNSGEFVDAYTFAGRRGQAIDVRLTSTAFDPYVMIAGPGDFNVQNDDDMEAGGKNARVSVTLPADGNYTIRATSYQSGETGAYRLAVTQATPVAAANAAQIALGQSVRGNLASGDSTLGNGSFVDRYRFRATQGDHVTIDMRSAAFDSYLTLVSPSGAREQNDDSAQDNHDARIDTELAETGDYVLMATSFGQGSGAYDLSLQRGGGERIATPAPNVTSSGVLTSGASVNGQLASGDAALSSGEFFDRYTFQGRRGQTVSLEMTSAALDSYLIVQAPSGAQEDNDDAGGDTHNSRVRWVLPEDGTYGVRATSYAARETGAYALRFLSGTAAETPITQAARRGKVFAVMVGISDYGGTGDLAFTADDALKLAETLRRENVLAPQSVTLTNAQATPAAVRAAFQRVAAAAGPDDLFLFFYSGHGGQTAERVRGNEPDSKDETIVLRGGEITDDEMAQMFAQVRARTSLLALDACFSGGFARDVVSRPGVMGFFSSEEDLTSAVADKFQAGGYLAHFLRSGLSGEADTDANRIVTAGEMSTYLRRQFATQASDVDATTQEGEHGYQYLVVERGGVKVDDPVLTLPPA